MPPAKKKAHRRLKWLFKPFFRAKTGKTTKRRPSRLKKPKFKARDPKENEVVLGLSYEDKDKNGRPLPRPLIVQKGIDQKYRSTHFYVIGGTGFGKTKFLQNLIIQDIIHQRGFGIIDPHGDLIEEVKGWLMLCYDTYFPDKSLQDDVVLIDPTNRHEIATFNPLERTQQASSGLQARRLLSAMEKIWADFWGPRMANILLHTLIALSEADLTLAEIPLFLTNTNFRKNVLAKVKEPLCKQFFKTDFDSVNARTRREWIESTLNKVYAFLATQEARHLIGAQKSTVHLRDIIDNQKILLIKLDKGQLMDTSDLLGSLLLSKIQMAAFSRTDVLKSKRVPFYLYIDEFQNFASESFIEVLSEARKYGLSLIMAHQELTQVPAKLRASVLANCGIQVFFKLRREDAELLAKEGFRVTSILVKDMRIGSDSVTPVYFTTPEEWEQYIQQLQDLRQGECVVFQRIEGGVLELESIYTPDPWEEVKMDEGLFKELVKKKRIGARYLRRRKDIDREIQARQKEFMLVKEPTSFRDSNKLK